MELTFYKANENGYGRSEDIFIYRCAIATEKRRADGIPFPGVLHPGVGLSSTIYLLLENTSISAADLLLPSSIALSADALGSSSLHLQGSLGRKINIWYMFFEWIRMTDFSICKYFILETIMFFIIFESLLSQVSRQLNYEIFYPSF